MLLFSLKQIQVSWRSRRGPQKNATRCAKKTGGNSSLIQQIHCFNIDLAPNVLSRFVVKWSATLPRSVVNNVKSWYSVLSCACVMGTNLHFSGRKYDTRCTCGVEYPFTFLKFWIKWKPEFCAFGLCALLFKMSSRQFWCFPAFCMCACICDICARLLHEVSRMSVLQVSVACRCCSRTEILNVSPRLTCREKMLSNIQTFRLIQLLLSRAGGHAAGGL